MTITTSSSFPNNPVLLHFKEELHKNPADFEKKKRLYYVAAVISSLVATAFFLSFIPLQTMMLPFWLSITGAISAQSAAGLFAKTAGDMIQNAQEAGKVASRLREMQNTYQGFQENSLSEPEKIIMVHATLAEKEYAEAEQSLQELIENTNSLSPKSRLEEIIQLQHQALLLKIDVCFKSAILDAVVAGNLSCLMKKKDLLIISDQDPLKRNQIQGLNDVLKNKFTEPLIYFKKPVNIFWDNFNCKESPRDLYYEDIETMSPESLAGHMFTLMNEPLTLSI